MQLADSVDGANTPQGAQPGPGTSGQRKVVSLAEGAKSSNSSTYWELMEGLSSKRLITFKDPDGFQEYIEILDTKEDMAICENAMFVVVFCNSSRTMWFRSGGDVRSLTPAIAMPGTLVQDPLEEACENQEQFQ